jgi:ribosomal protein L11 methyltransferase
VKWLEASLTTSAENAEAVADVLARFASGGTAISGEIQTAGAPLTVRAYLAEAAASESVQQQMREAIWHLSQIVTLPEPSFRWIEGEDWAETWRKHFHPIAAGRRLVIVPAWMQPNDPLRRPLFLDPGMAFGTGAHPSTRHSIETLEERIQLGDLVVDVGCGSGILSIAAVLFGAGHVLACDIDEHAIAATVGNAELNGVASQIEVFQGSLSQVGARLAGFRPADVLAANILASVLRRMLLEEGLADLVGPAGWIVLSGILGEQRDEVDAAARLCALNLEAEAVEGDWVTLTYRKRS